MAAIFKWIRFTQGERRNLEPDVNVDLNVPVEEVNDVMVVGGGPSGCTAASAAARESGRTLLIAGSGALGGSGTSALVPAW